LLWVLENCAEREGISKKNKRGIVMKKIRVDFVARCSVVVQVNECDDMYDNAVELAEQYIQGNPEIRPMWEVEDDGVDDADDEDCVDVKE
jgi:hypothetical protein